MPELSPSSSPLANCPNGAANSLCNLGVVQTSSGMLGSSPSVSETWSFVLVGAYGLPPGFHILLLKEIIARLVKETNPLCLFTLQLAVVENVYLSPSHATRDRVAHMAVDFQVLIW